MLYIFTGNDNETFTKRHIVFVSLR